MPTRRRRACSGSRAVAALKAFSTRATCRASTSLDDTGKPLDLARLPGRMALAGLDPEPVITRAVDRATGEVRWSRIKATGVRDPDGGVRLAINLVEDITELKRSEESPALPGRGVAAAGGVDARLRAHAGG